jgi:hypothetical protein
MLFIKSKPFPEGTIRKHGDIKVRKENGGWVPLKNGKSQKEELEESKNKKKIEINKVSGSKELFEGLKKVSESRLYIDTIDPEDKPVLNKLTKERLITWVHVGENDYKAELTDAGKKALDLGFSNQKKVNVNEEDTMLNEIAKDFDDENFYFNIMRKINE